MSFTCVIAARIQEEVKKSIAEGALGCWVRFFKKIPIEDSMSYLRPLNRSKYLSPGCMSIFVPPEADAFEIAPVFPKPSEDVVSV